MHFIKVFSTLIEMINVSSVSFKNNTLFLCEITRAYNLEVNKLGFVVSTYHTLRMYIFAFQCQAYPLLAGWKLTSYFAHLCFFAYKME